MAMAAWGGATTVQFQIHQKNNSSIANSSKNKRRTMSSESSEEGAVEKAFLSSSAVEEIQKEMAESEQPKEKAEKVPKRKAALKKSAAGGSRPKKPKKKASKAAAAADDSSEDIQEIEFVPKKKIKQEVVSEEDEPKEKAPGKHGKNEWLRAPGLSPHMFGQCTECQAIQKQLSDVVVQKKGGLTARVIQCNKCFAGNHKMRVFKQEQFATTTKLTPIGEHDFFPENDDYKVVSAMYSTVTMQCNYCNMKQQKMSDGELIEKLDKHHVAVHIAQCSSCRFANKLWQKCFWDNFSNYNKTKAATGDKKKKKTKEIFAGSKKRKAQKETSSSSSSSSSSEESSSSSSSEEEEEPIKKKKKSH